MYNKRGSHFRGGGWDGGRDRGHGGGSVPNRRGAPRGGRGFNNVPEPTELLVRTNENRLVFTPTQDPADDDSGYVQCKVTFKNAWKQKQRVRNEETGEDVLDEQGRLTFVLDEQGNPRLEFKVDERNETDEKQKKRFMKTPLPWRIIKKWAEQEGTEIGYDGGDKAYFPSEFAPEEDRVYQVQVKKDCEEDDEDAARVRNKWFAVSFKMTNVIPFADVQAVLTRGGQLRSTEKILTMLTVILKSDAMLTKGMISLKPNSSAVFFPLDMQKELLKAMDRNKQGEEPRVPRLQETRDKTKMLLSGLKMTAVSRKGNVYVETEALAQYVDKDDVYYDYLDEHQRDGRRKRVPLLDTNNGSRGASIAGVRIDSPHQPITNPLKRAQIEEAIGRKLINAEYVYQQNGQERERLYKNKSMVVDKEDNSTGKGSKIFWSADDATAYSFTVKEEGGTERFSTVAEFFLWKYGIKLKYPKMPIVHLNKVGKNGGPWLPIEFLYQAFAKSKENTEEMVLRVLKYHDTFAGMEYVDEVSKKLNMLSVLGEDNTTFQDRLQRWRISIDSRPVEIKAKCLKAPTIRFKNGPASTKNGSFNLLASSRPVTFSKPAKLQSFVLINFAKYKKKKSHECMEHVLGVAADHGIEIPSMIMDIARGDDLLDQVSVDYEGHDDVGDALEVSSHAIQKARNFYLYDNQRYYRKKHAFFQTQCYSEDQKEYECIVLPPTKEGGHLGLLLDYNKYNLQTQYFSHEVETHGGMRYKARLMVKIRETEDPKKLIDPLDFRYHNGRHQALFGERNNEVWTNVTFDCFVYDCKKQDIQLREKQIKSMRFIHNVDDWEVDFPSIVFAYKPDKGKALYDQIKIMSNNFGGIQSQCIVAEKYENQKNQFAKDQYASNIATKMNAKLSTINDKAASWTGSCDGTFGDNGFLPWVGEQPTLVVGVGQAHGMGRNNESIVAASVCLDSGCMRLYHSCFMQKKTDTVITSGVMKDIIKVSVEHYFLENKCYPKRILFYRDGMSDGQMKRTSAEINDGQMSHVDYEIDSIRKAVAETVGDAQVPITYVICQSQQLGFRMVPATQLYKSRGKPENNVWSGTMLDATENSFYLVPQQGLKGTSKPVKYIVYQNENESPSRGYSGLTMDNLKNLTNQMSWVYPTATKAVRELPLIKYAKRLANQVLASRLCLMSGCNWSGEQTQLICPQDDFATEEERRSYLEVTSADGQTHRQYNLCNMPFRHHLAA